ncbi:hypothetical protein [Afipia felis]|uniref:Uncharacterized protein n=2 Tax=Afipia felis TaxID=1035 RepID=A0A380WAQ1_AFIFE|nr:hypothetical protein [Afipia felis]EKS29295.1 hypothetical protein HMPREF9697_01823 [Afipia felis ATCC 53690]SUU78003.1 Uncharacterised protein [Afipia felis]SUU86068.1 Uncharacterised protein [Afipia felis]
MFSIRNSSARSTPDDRQGVATVGLLLTVLTLLLGSAAAWITHVIVCIKASAWVLLAFGCIVAPVGVIHGIGVWLGVF